MGDMAAGIKPGHHHKQYWILECGLRFPRAETRDLSNQYREVILLRARKVENHRIIIPTVGRQVWYRPCTSDASDGDMARVFDQPLAATVVAVANEREVNLFVLDAAGVAHPRLGIPLIQPGDVPQTDGMSYCEWMPYQIQAAGGQAK